jgi:hypothetical protein
MSRSTIYFLAEAADFDGAESRVSSYLDTETFYDHFTVLDDKSGGEPSPLRGSAECSGPLSEKRQDLMGFIKGWDWKKNADDFLHLAERYKAAGDLGQYGYHLIRAGELYAQYLTIDAYVYNVESSDYAIPSEDSLWWVVAVDFHY